MKEQTLQIAPVCEGLEKNSIIDKAVKAVKIY